MTRQRTTGSQGADGNANLRSRLRVRRSGRLRPKGRNQTRLRLLTDVKDRPEAKRSSARMRVLKSAKISFKQGTVVIDCTVRDISDGGARLLVASVIGIPDLFELAIPGEPIRQCRLIWRKSQQIGVAFI